MPLTSLTATSTAHRSFSDNAVADSFFVTLEWTSGNECLTQIDHRPHPYDPSLRPRSPTHPRCHIHSSTSSLMTMSLSSAFVTSSDSKLKQATCSRLESILSTLSDIAWITGLQLHECLASRHNSRTTLTNYSVSTSVHNNPLRFTTLHGTEQVHLTVQHVPTKKLCNRTTLYTL